jgi:hypothetical protein
MAAPPQAAQTKLSQNENLAHAQNCSHSDAALETQTAAANPPNRSVLHQQPTLASVQKSAHMGTIPNPRKCELLHTPAHTLNAEKQFQRRRARH